MQYENLLRSIDPAHEQLVGRVLDLFDSYRVAVADSARDKRDALIENDAEYARVRESAEEACNASLEGVESDDDPRIPVAHDELERKFKLAAEAHQATNDAIFRASAARDARSYEWFTTQLALVRHDFNIQLIEAITEFGD